MNSVLTFTIEWRPAPAGDVAPCHLCEFKACKVWLQPCKQCLQRKEIEDCYPVITRSDILPF